MVSDEILSEIILLYLNITSYTYIELCVNVFALLIESSVGDRPRAPRFKLSDLPSDVTASDIETCLYAVSEDITDVEVTVLGGGKASANVQGILGRTPFVTLESGR